MLSQKEAVILSTILVIGTVLLTIGAVGLMENILFNRKKKDSAEWTIEEPMPVVNVKEV
jgi:hypothetical protein